MNNNTERSDAEKYLDDAATTAKIKAKFLADDAIKVLSISVTTENCKVTLSGNIEDQNIINHAIEIAKNTAGVTDVNYQAE